MRGSTPFDEDGLFGGEFDPAALPPELRRVAELVRAARAAATPAELADDAGVIGAVAQLAASRGIAAELRRHRTRRLALVKAGAVAAAVLVGGGAAAAATGALPAPIQRVVARDLKAVGVSVPEPAPGPGKRPAAPSAHAVVPPAPHTTLAPVPTVTASREAEAHTKLVRGWCVADERPAGTRSAALARELAATAASAHESLAQLCAALVPNWRAPATAAHPTPPTAARGAPARGAGAPNGAAPKHRSTPGAPRRVGSPAEGRSRAKTVTGQGVGRQGRQAGQAHAATRKEGGAGRTPTGTPAAAAPARHSSAQTGGAHPLSTLPTTARRATPRGPSSQRIARHVVTTTSAPADTATAPVGPRSGNSASHARGGAGAVAGGGGHAGK